MWGGACDRRQRERSHRRPKPNTRERKPDLGFWLKFGALEELELLELLELLDELEDDERWLLASSPVCTSGTGLGSTSLDDCSAVTGGGPSTAEAREGT
jgi:hypothetical protein